MASSALPIPRGTFTHLSRQLQQTRRHASSTTIPATPFPAGLFKPPSSIIAPWKTITGAREWQTSTYHYNPQTAATLPTAAVTATNLLNNYATMIRSRGLASTGSSGTARSAVAMRRKSFEKVYVGGMGVKDFGDRVVVDAFVFDAVEAEREERERRDRERRERRKAEGGQQGEGAGAGGRRRRRPPPGAGAVGAGAGARRFSRNAGAQRAAGAGR
ncbi:hypothetical protein BAUCODRAFT_466051 [Baudoinia panamericana UAMH 10762]|uniref:Uncharacterized protein n=1 Tax=Baudoinia panamericana (strain UAMH 10762) TaxID=717646 RepID=M2LP75_BAUPA|nr:uncharacterized protein BAUCODRAFT_466051 [Baudoinia panamericana UAMH 10762]EMC96182.1 hypothetical protein BAUCODRAFT_466051 [Baudoinia panamericana UAMH 10762]